MIDWPVPVLQGKYLTWYNQLIHKASNRIFPEHEYGEKHHVIPRSLGGSNRKNNIVKLYPREHYIAHLLLYKFTTDIYKQKMVSALLYMAHGSNFPERLKRTYKVNSRIYSMARKAASELFKGKTVSEETKQKIREANARTKDLRSQKLSGKNNPMYGKKHDESMKQHLSEVGKKHWTETLRNEKSKKTKELWQNEEYRNKMLEIMSSSEAVKNKDWKKISEKVQKTKIKNGTNKLSEQGRKNISEARKAGLASGKIVPWNKGKQVGVFRTKESLVEGAKKAALTRKKNGTQISMKGENNPFYGKKHSQESIEKWRKTMAEKKASGWVPKKREVNWEGVEKAKKTRLAKKQAGYVSKKPQYTEESKKAMIEKMKATKSKKRAEGWNPLKGKPKSPEHIEAMKRAWEIRKKRISKG